MCKYAGFLTAAGIWWYVMSEIFPIMLCQLLMHVIDLLTPMISI